MTHISEWLCIEPDVFEPYQEHIVHPILNFIERNINSFTNADISEVTCIAKSPCDSPCCVRADDGWVVYVNLKVADIPEWIYQFSHEYMHRIIGRCMSPDYYNPKVEGQLWFEETLCETSSLFQMDLLSRMMMRQSGAMRAYGHLVRACLDKLSAQYSDLKLQLRENGGVRQWLPLLSEPRYHRAHYNAVACRVLPLFLDNPHLWRMVCHIGDSRRYESLDTLFAHLLRNADNSYRQSLQNLIRMLS